MAWYPARGGGIPASVKTDMNAVLNKKFGTSAQTYPPKEWADDVNLMGLLPIRTASGTVASFSDGADDVPCVSVVAQIVPIQEGTGDPSPSNVRPITGHTACEVKNSPFTPVNDVISFLPIQEGTGAPSLTNVRPIHAPLTITRDDESTLVVYGGSLNVETGELTIEWKPYTGSWTHYASSNSYKAYRSTLLDRTKYTTSAMANEIAEFGSFSSASMTKNIIQLPTNSVTNFYLALDENEDPEDVQLVYQLYTAEVVQLSTTELTRALDSLGIETYTIPFGQTVYAGELDVTTGEGSITHQMYDMSALSWNKNGSTPTFYSGIIQGITEQTADFYCTCYLPTVNGGYNAQNWKCSLRGEIGQTRIWVCDNRFETSADFRASLTNQKIVLPKATPTEIALTPEEVNTFYGANNIWADTGATEVEYRADIDLLLASLQGNRGLQMTRSTPPVEEEQTEEVEENEDER